jgi:FkbM family methyltransferase
VLVRDRDCEYPAVAMHLPSSLTRRLERLWSARGRLHVSALQRLGLLDHVNLLVHAPVGERSFRVPLTQGVGLHHLWPVEAWLDRLIARLASRRRGIFVDVGVNVGQTLLKLKSVAPEHEYWGFEPNPRCYCYVQQLIDENHLSNCRVYPFALGERPAVVELLLKSKTDPAASILPGFRPDSEYSSRQFVSVFPGDDLFSSSTAVSIVKIDVEGAELEVLRGLQGTLARTRPAVICEILPVYERDSERGQFRLGRQQAIEKMMRELRYDLLRIHPDGRLQQIAEIGVHSDLERTNYLLVSDGELSG